MNTYIKDDINSFLGQYTRHGEILKFYSYDPADQKSYEKRIKTKNNGIEANLSKVIQEHMSFFDLTEEQLENIDLLGKGHKVVIGGQQAGIMVSPLYTIHKIISVIKLAEEQSEKLGEKIVPVFWIAGEDHDFDEVNHSYLFNDQFSQMNKVKYHTMADMKDSISNIEMEEDAFKNYMHEFISLLSETKYTKDLKKMLESSPANWVRHFEKVIHELFKNYGLLFIDSHDKQLRTLESSILLWMLEYHQVLNESFLKGQRKVEDEIGEVQIVTDTNVHLFVSVDKERQLLKYEDGIYIAGNSGNHFTKEELINMIQNSPELFSNNVVTRPLMQESIFNTLAFIGGPSELKYWAELKEVFTYNQIEMPVIVPRMRLTYMLPSVKRIVEDLNLDIERIVLKGTEADRAGFLKAQEDVAFINQVEKTRHKLETDYQHLEIKDSEKIFSDLIKSNLKKHEQQFDYLLKKYRLEIERKSAYEMKRFRTVNHVLHPKDGLQERIWHPLQMMNIFGLNHFDNVYKEIDSYSFDHIIID